MIGRIVLLSIISILLLIIFSGIFSKKKNNKEIEVSPDSDHDKDKHEEKPRQLWKENLQFIIAVLFIIASGILFFFLIRGIFVKDIPEVPQKAVVETVEVGKTKTVYRFSEYWDNTIRVPVKKNAEFYPKGGKVKIVAPSGNSWVDEPGTAVMRPPEDPGMFQFSVPKGSNAWGVEIWQ